MPRAGNQYPLVQFKVALGLLVKEVCNQSEVADSPNAHIKLSY